MKIRDLFKRSTPKVKIQPTKLKAIARRAEMVSEQSYDEDEPNVRLSRAFLVVMLLHVVAVGGIFAFSSLKKDSPTPAVTGEAKVAPVTSETLPDSRSYIVNKDDTLVSIASSFGISRLELQAANKLPADYKVEEGDKLFIPQKSTAQPGPLNVPNLAKLAQAPAAAAASSASIPKTTNSEKATDEPAASGKFYVVQKGENPVGIAKKLKVKYADLIKINNLADPRKLQIGQKLIIPE